MSQLSLLFLFFSFVLAAICTAGYFVLYRTSALSGEGSTKDVLAETFRSLGDALPRSSGAEIRSLLISAGHRSPAAVSIYNGVSYSAAALTGILSASILQIAIGDLTTSVIIGVCAAGMAHLIAKRVLARMAKARAFRLNGGLPTVLDLMVLSVEAGQSLDQSIYDASREVRNAFPDLADELTQVYLSLRANTTRADVFREFGDRNPDSELRKLATLLVDSDRFGSSLGPALRTHARYLRVRRRQQAQEQARKVTTKLVFPIFFLIFPAVLVVTLGPAVIQMMNAFQQFANLK